MNHYYSIFELFVKSVQMRSCFWSVFSCIQIEYGDLPSNSPYSVQIQENTDEKLLCIWAIFRQWRLFDVLINFYFTTSETMQDYYL